jgi:prepilin-type N-terminal cleavage/methylation domain-containing protein
MMSMSIARGFTLIEVLVVALIAALLTTIAVPTYADFSARHKVATAAQSLALELRQARYEAVQRGTALYVNPTAGASWCVAVSADAACQCGQPNCALRTIDAAQYPGVTMTLGVPVSFDGQQGRSDAGLVAVLTANRRFGSEVQLTASGRPRVCSSGAPLPDMPSC